jgi:hypothetical protein
MVMGEFEEMARAAAQQKAAKRQEDKARREEAQREAEAQRHADEQMVNQHILPVLREAKKDLDREGTQCAANFNRSPPTFAMSLVIGHRNTPAVSRRQPEITVQPVAGGFTIRVTSENAPEANWRSGAEDFRANFKKAFQDALNRWHGLGAYH